MVNLFLLAHNPAAVSLVVGCGRNLNLTFRWLNITISYKIQMSHIKQNIKLLNILKHPKICPGFWPDAERNRFVGLRDAERTATASHGVAAFCLKEPR